MENEHNIQNYENGKLSSQDRQDFEKRLKTDSIFAQEVKEYRDLRAAIKLNERQELNALLKNLEAQEEQKESYHETDSVSFFKKYRHIYAAAAVIIFAITIFQFLQKEPTTQDLYASYYQPYPNTVQPIVRGESNEDLLSQAFLSYEAGAFDAAAPLFRKSLAQKYDPDIAFYEAMSLLGTGTNQAEALNLIDRLKKEETSFTAQLYWYSALIALKNGAKDAALVQLDSLSGLKSGYKDRVVLKLKKELEE